MNWQELMARTLEECGNFAKEVPDLIGAYEQMGKVAKADGALSQKTKEFMALGIAIATRCDSCIGFHVQALVRLKTTREEFCEGLAMATYMGGGPSYAFSAKALNAYDVFSK
ncbi:carboxymuconolactone decarboxylase family protein [Pseudopelagicola sp. nBUS_19]|uniref:carboxymuconolactone decarboxylase family protein n=1 Tax=Pseudopelagicola sp. nBUS_19 TaxID=3395316 RepID=UPI003EBC1569